VSETETDLDDADAEAVPTGSRRARRRRSTRRNTVEWVVVIGGALLVAVIIKTFLFQAFYIPSTSMEPTLKVGDRVLVNKLSYDLHDVHRGDVVVFRRPSDTNQVVTVKACNGEDVQINRTATFAQEKVDDLIKRVIALPGESVEQRDDGHIYINGNLLDEPYLKQTTGVQRSPWSYKPQCIKVPDHEVFVMGDNGTNSQASNSFGPIEESLIVGRAFIRVWPLGSFGTL
jgi:signal peptidase I